MIAKNQFDGFIMGSVSSQIQVLETTTPRLSSVYFGNHFSSLELFALALVLFPLPACLWSRLVVLHLFRFFRQSLAM